MKPQTAAHTPTPWTSEVGHAKGSGMIWYRADSLSSLVATAHDETVCEEHGGTAIGNAAFIVLCVNQHQELVNLLKECIETSKPWSEDFDDWAKKVEQAIAKAEGKQ